MLRLLINHQDQQQDVSLPSSNPKDNEDQTEDKKRGKCGDKEKSWKYKSRTRQKKQTTNILTISHYNWP